MTAWTASFVEAVSERLRDQDYWESRLNSDREDKHSLHLAVFVEPFLRFVLEGKKTVESRFSVHRCPPYGAVQQGDALLIKQSGGPVVAIAEVGHVWFYEIDKKELNSIRAKFGLLMCAEEPDFWESKTKSCYATLMQLRRVETITALPCPKRDRRGWVVLNRLQSPVQQSLR